MGISAMGIVDISWQRTTHKLPDPPYWDDKVPDAEYDGLPVQHFSLPFKKKYIEILHKLNRGKSQGKSQEWNTFCHRIWQEAENIRHDFKNQTWR